MHKSKITLIFILLVSFRLSAQYLISKADSAQIAGDFRLAINLYYAQHAVNENSLNLASAYAYLGMQDSALFFLQRQKELYRLPVSILCAPDFAPLHKTKEWITMTENIKQEYFKANPELNKELIEKLWQMSIYGQYYRGARDFYTKKFGGGSVGKDSINKLQTELDSFNLIQLENIIAEYGWPKSSEIADGITESVPFLIIQHAKSVQTQKKYLPLLKEMVEKGEADSRSFAYLTDRVLVKEGKKQRYGTQVEENKKTGKTELCPIEDESNVDKLRKEIGLEPLKDYLQMFGIKYEK
ncbi:MAG: hypothetical protein P1P88_14870 [Bacteroidales bacterium]|nr:hypothetical protein [Bacteroidales bacterium]